MTNKKDVEYILNDYVNKRFKSNEIHLIKDDYYEHKLFQIKQ